MAHYLTQILLTPEILVRKKITDTYSIHRIVYDQFPRKNPVVSMRALPLWSLSMSGVFSKVVILSNEMPRDDVEPYIKKNRSFIVYPDEIMNYKNYYFKITVNPVVKQNDKIIAIKEKQSIRQWFCGLGLNNGFKVSERFVINRVSADIFNKKENKITINKAEVSGELSVIDQEKFKKAVLNGIGREKSFGCGLLQIVPKDNSK